MENDKTTNKSDPSKMKQEIELLKRTVQQYKKEFEALEAKNKELLQNNSDLRQRLLTERHQWQAEQDRRQKQKEGFVDYYRDQILFILKENKDLSDALQGIDRLSPDRNPQSRRVSRSLPSTASVNRFKEDEKQLQSFLSDYRKHGIECSKEFLVRKLEIVKKFVTRNRAEMQTEMRNISEEAKRTEKEQLEVIKAREEELKLARAEFEELQYEFNETFSTLSQEITCLRADLKEKELENLKLSNCKQTSEKLEEHSDSENIVDVYENTRSLSTSSSSDGLSDDSADVVAPNNIPKSTGTIVGDHAVASGSTTSTVTAGTTVADDDDGADTSVAHSTTTPLLSRGAIMYANPLTPVSEKRKAISSDFEEASKKMKSSPEPRSQRDPSTKDTEVEMNPRILQLEREVLQQKSQLEAAEALLLKQKYALMKIMEMDVGSSLKCHVLPNTGTDQVAHQKTARDFIPQLLPVSPITREEARTFSSVEEFRYATFSEAHHMIAYDHPNFLLHVPIGICNPERTFCYMNSVVQALANIPSFAVTLVCGFDSNEGSLLHAMYQTYKHMWIRRTDSMNTNRLSVLTAGEIRSYYSQNKSADFDPTLQHDADEFLGDLISTLESEVNNKDGGEDEDNLVTRLFRGYIVAPDGSNEYFRILRLSILDDGISTVLHALNKHLYIRSPIDNRPEPLAVNAFLQSISTLSTTNVDHRESLHVPEGPEKSSQAQMKENKVSEQAAILSSFSKWTKLLGVDVENELLGVDVESDVQSMSQTTAETTARSDDNSTHQNTEPLLEDFYFDDSYTPKYRKIYTPEILCVSLNRHENDYTFNLKVLPAEDLTIPADLRAPEDTKTPARYKLMSVVQYIPGDPSSGHYYTYIKTGSGYSYKLDDEFVTFASKDDFDLTASGGRSVLFIYVRQPDDLH